jgi:hypothetical protein
VRPAFGLGVAACGALLVVAVSDGLGCVIHGVTIFSGLTRSEAGSRKITALR